ncbi:MAG TPA: MBL fold metallo-hydrolase [Ktedonobacterales bacterium]|nr:MBL fold metallo-hydrolase [Ktedonobacterales bacterium]
MRVFPDIHRVDGVSCNVYIITEPEGLTIVDAGMPGAEKRILAAVTALGHAPRDVRHILLTHQHVDHIGGLAALALATRADTWASAGDTPAIEGQAKREAPHGPLGVIFRALFFSRLQSAAIGHSLREGDTLPILSHEGGVRVIETPGHTVGHISFYVPARRLLFAGDAVRSSSGRLPISPAMLNHDTPMAVRSVGKLAALEIEACLPGHGAPVTVGAQALLAATAGVAPLSRV